MMRRMPVARYFLDRGKGRIATSDMGYWSKLPVTTVAP